MNPSTGRFCRDCGYDLSGAPAGRCPECAREFDAGDARTFDRRWRGSRGARWRRRVILAAGLLVLAAALAPRGYSEARLKFRSPRSTPVEMVRVQLIAPRWLSRATGAGYPGWTWPAPGVKASVMASEFSSCVHTFTLRGVSTGGWMSAKNDALDAGQVTVNGVFATRANADAILRGALLADGRRAVRSLGASMVGMSEK